MLILHTNFSMRFMIGNRSILVRRSRWAMSPKEVFTVLYDNASFRILYLTFIYFQIWVVYMFRNVTNSQRKEILLISFKLTKASEISQRRIQFLFSKMAVSRVIVSVQMYISMNNARIWYRREIGDRELRSRSQNFCSIPYFVKIDEKGLWTKHGDLVKSWKI